MDNTFDSLYFSHGEHIAGIDESGVSDIAGPLVAACVVLPKLSIDSEDIRVFAVNDSKKIPEKYRKGYAQIIWNAATAIGIGEVQPSEIDYLGKRRSTILAMTRAVAACQTKDRQGRITPDALLIDGEFSLPLEIPQFPIKDGDTKSLCIASASVIAKVYRDDVMLALHQRFPNYGWNSNKGYPCENQFRGMDTHGIQVGIHRTKFWPFSANSEDKEDAKKWYYRRGLWREKTTDAMTIDALSGTKIVSNKPSGRHSRHSKKACQDPPPSGNEP